MKLNAPWVTKNRKIAFYKESFYFILQPSRGRYYKVVETHYTHMYIVPKSLRLPKYKTTMGGVQLIS